MGRLLPVGPTDDDFVDLAGLAQAEVENSARLREITAAGIDFGRLLGSVFKFQRDTRTDRRGIARFAFEPHGENPLLEVGSIFKGQEPIVVDADDEVGATVTIQVGDGQAFGVAGHDRARPLSISAQPAVHAAGQLRREETVDVEIDLSEKWFVGG